MKIENITKLGSAGGITYKFSEIKENIGNPNIHLTLNDDRTNCKLSYIHGAGCLAQCKNDDVRKKVLNEVLKLPDVKGCIIINTTQKSVFDFINNNYEVYYANEVPVGYGTAYQYHICIRNHIRPHYSCRVPENKPANEKKGLTKTIIANKLGQILRKKRRKNDYIGEFINSL